MTNNCLLLDILGHLSPGLWGVRMLCQPNENQDFVEEKFKELDSDQIEGAEFEFLGLEIRFERNKSFDFRCRILISDSRTEF